MINGKSHPRDRRAPKHGIGTIIQDYQPQRSHQSRRDQGFQPGDVIDSLVDLVRSDMKSESTACGGSSESAVPATMLLRRVVK